MNSTEVGSSTKCSYSAQESQLVRVEVFMLLTFILSLILYPIGIARRCYNGGLLKGLALGLDAAVIALIPYVLGLMRNFDLKPGLFPVWSMYLLYVNSSVPSILKLTDPIAATMALVKNCLHIYYFSSLIPLPRSTKFYEPFQNYTATMFGICIISMGLIFKAFEVMFVIGRVTYGSLQDALRTVVVPTNNGGGDTHALVEQSRSGGVNDPWIRCNYLVYDGITLQEIWSCGEPTFSSSSGDLKSYCLSLSLLWKLLSKFKGRISYQSSHKEEAWELVKDGLLLSSSSRCPFRVIELELALLYDYLYNTSCSMLYNLGFPWSLIMQSMSLFGIVFLAAVSLKEYRPKEGTARIQYHKHDVDVLLTWFVIMASTVLGLVQFIVFVTSRWSQTMLIITYITLTSRRRETQDQNCWDSDCSQ